MSARFEVIRANLHYPPPLRPVERVERFRAKEFVLAATLVRSALVVLDLKRAPDAEVLWLVGVPVASDGGEPGSCGCELCGEEEVAPVGEGGPDGGPKLVWFRRHLATSESEERERSEKREEREAKGGLCERRRGR